MATLHCKDRIGYKNSIKLLAVLWLLTILVCNTSCYTIKDFHTIYPWQYKSKGLYKVDIGLREPEDKLGVKLYEGMMVAAIGDLNDDKHNDIITISNNQHHLTVHFYDEQRFNFAKSNTIDMGECKISSVTVIVSPPYRLALLWSEKMSYEYIRLLEDVVDGQKAAWTDLDMHKIQKGSQPMFFDIDSDTYTDFIFNTNDVVTDEWIRVVYFNQATSSFESNTVGFFDTYLIKEGFGGWKGVPDPQLRLSVPHFSTLTDVNADCIADLYLTVTTTGLDLKGLTLTYSKFKEGPFEYMKYCLTQVEELSAAGYTSPIFADFDNDATIDRAFYNTNLNSISIFYNTGRAKGVGSNLWNSIPVITNTTIEKSENYNMNDEEADSYKVPDSLSLFSDPNFPFVPGQMRTGDLNSDGYTDILVTVQTETGDSKTLVLLNIPCNTTDWKRTFEHENEFSIISERPETSYGFVMDFDDDGRIDFVVIERYGNKKTSIASFYNNFSRDSYYVSASIFTHSPNSYGFKPFGVFCRGVYTSLSDHKSVFVSSQLTRTSYTALQNPVATYAIGRSNNFIEDFTVSYPHQIDDRVNKPSVKVERRNWSPIIPNSNLLIGINQLESIKWTIQLLINPTQSFLLIGITLTVILMVIGGVIIYIHIKEKREDEESRNPNLDFI